jgi:4a-hydroxytetrahydrobiopterin dehydratase
MARPRLDTPQLEASLRELAGWSLEQGRLHREFRFADFTEAMGFVLRAALVAERMDHHPEWSNVWNRVVVDLTTHDAGGITAADVELARRLSALAGAPPAPTGFSGPS